MNEDELYRSVGGFIAVRRNELKLTQENVAKKVGLSRASLANIEAGRQKILLHYLYRLAAVLDVTGVEAWLPAHIRPGQVEPPETLSIGGNPISDKQRTEVLAFVAQSVSKRRSFRGK